MIHLDHAGTSWPKAQAAIEAAEEVLRGPLEARDLAGDAAVVASFLGTSKERLLYTPGCTSALHLAIADLPWRPGDVALLGPFEHLALERPVRALEARGVEIEIVPPGPEGDLLDLDWLERRLRAGSVRALAVSAGANVTGALAPLSELRAITAARGVTVVLDAAQVVGWLPLELDAWGFDLVAMGAHKGTRALWGVGALYVRPGTKMETPRGDGAQAGPSWCDAGSLDRAALAGWAAAVGGLDPDHAPARLATARSRVRRLQRALEELPRLRALGPAEPSVRLPTVAIALEDAPPSAIAARLAEAGVRASGGLQCAPLAHASLGTLSSGGALRFSVGIDTTDDELEQAIVVLRGVLGGTS